MPWWLIVYLSINLVIAVYCTIIFAREGYYVSLSEKRYGKTNWGIVTLVFIILILAGLPIAIIGAIVLTIER